MEIKSVHRNKSFKVVLENSEHRLEGDITPNLKAKEVPQNTIDPIMWQVVLKKKPDKDYFTGLYKKVNTPKRNGIDKGHFIAECFMKFLIPDYEQNKKRIEFVFKDNGYNITGQSQDSNRGCTNIPGQAQYERKVDNHFDENDTDVYFEIEEIWDESNNPLGRRVYIHYYGLENKAIHVFIPENISDGLG